MVFGHSVERSWQEVGRVWRRIYMTKDSLEKRFGEEKAKLIPMDASPMKDSSDEKIDEDVDRALIYEGWDKTTKKAYWFSKGVKDFLDERDDPLGLEDFFPCPAPLYASLTNDTLVPMPDYCQYQDQACQLDVLSDRIDGLVKALRLMGVYDATQPALARLFQEGENGDLKPVKNWAAFAEKQGIKGAMDLVEIKPIAEALLAAYQAFDQVKNQVYEITRISDIMRGFVDPDEKLGQSQLKTQYSNLGIKSYQDEVGRFAQDLLRIKAQIMCNKFDAKTLAKLAAVDQLSEQNKPVIQPAMELLLGPRLKNPSAPGVNPLRSFRIDVQADSLIHLDEEREKQSRTEFLQAQSATMKEFIAPMLSAPPQIMAILAPVTMELWKFGTTAFKVGKNIEGAFDEAAEKLKQLAMQPQPQGVPPEELQKAQQELQKKAEELQAQEADLFKRETAHQVNEIKFDADQKVFAERVKVAEDRLGVAAKEKGLEIERKTDGANQAKKDAEQAGKKAEEKKGESAEAENRIQGVQDLLAAGIEENKKLAKTLEQVAQIAAAPREVVRDPKTGKVSGTRIAKEKA